jgi:hypothetical protein
VLGEGFLWLLEGLVVALALAAAAACALAWRRRPAAAAAVLAAGMALLATGAAFRLLPAFDAFKSARGLSEELRAHLAPGEEFAVFPRLDNTFLFYTGHRAVPVSSAAEVRAFMDRPGRGWLVAERDDWRQLDPPPPLVEVDRDADPREGYLLLTEPAAAPER